MRWGSTIERYSRAQAEVMVDTVTLLAASSVGLAVDGETIPYVSGWGEDGALEAVTRVRRDDRPGRRRIEDVLLAGADQAPADVAGAAGAPRSARRPVALGEQLAVDLANGVELLARVGERLLELEGVRVRDVQLRAQLVGPSSALSRAELRLRLAPECLVRGAARARAAAGAGAGCVPWRSRGPRAATRR